MYKKCFLILSAVLTTSIALSSVLQSTSIDNGGPCMIENDTFWHATDGTPLYSQGGGIFRYPDPQTGEERYYWYGMHYRGAETYCRQPLAMNKDTRFVSVTCYQSDDLLHWTHVADVLTPEAFHGHGRPFWVGRMGVAYIAEARCYALLIQFNSSLLICTSKSPLGPFEWHNQIDMTSRIGTPNTGDQTVFVDDDGKAYLVYSNGKGRNRIFLSEIGVKDGQVTLLDCHEIFHGGGREGNCMFRYKDTYYVCASDLYGWNASHVYYMKSKHIYGPYEPAEGMAFMPGSELDYGHVTQTGFFYRVKGSEEETVIYCGDRWSDFAGNGNGFNQWVPLTIDADEVPHFHSLSQWTIDASTGHWQVGPDNEYVLNGSFEADRRIIPIQKKPVQDFMHAWDTEVLKGNVVRVADSHSPKLNYFNTPDDRQTVVGNYSLNISDEVDYERRVSQQIFSTERVPLADGTYTLRAQVKVKGEFDLLQMFAEGPAGNFHIDIAPGDTLWHEIVIPDVKVSGGQLRVGFHAKGTPHSQCRVDDVSLKLSEPASRHHPELTKIGGF